MNVAVPVFDILALASFVTGLVIVLSIPTSAETPLSTTAKTCFALAFAVYVFAMFSNTLEHAGITTVLDPPEDYIEILFPSLVLYGAYAVHVRNREMDLLSSQRAALSSQQMLLGIMDTAPAGILVLDPSGRITFANEAAKEILDLAESTGGSYSTPGWSIRVGAQPPGTAFAELTQVEAGHAPVPVSITWPTGWHVELMVRTERITGANGLPGGVVASFLPPDGMRASGPEA